MISKAVAVRVNVLHRRIIIIYLHDICLNSRLLTAFVSVVVVIFVHF